MGARKAGGSSSSSTAGDDDRVSHGSTGLQAFESEGSLTLLPNPSVKEAAWWSLLLDVGLKRHLSTI